MAVTDLLQPTGRTGVFFIPALGYEVLIAEWREDDVYDHVRIASGAVTAGLKREFFRDIEGKNLQDTNLTRQRNINSGSELVMNRVGILVAQAVGNVITDPDDIVKIGYGSSFTFKVDRRVVAEGPTLKFSTGYGVTGQTTVGNRGYVSYGVASAAAAPELVSPQQIKDSDALFGILTFESADWFANYAQPNLAQDVKIGCFLHGLLKTPVGK